MSSLFHITTDSFDGPLDLLYQLTIQKKLSLHDVSLSSVVDAYLAILEDNNEVTLSDYASFITIASTLVLMKAISLVPSLEISNEEEESISLLELRLASYECVQKAAKVLEERWGKHIKRSVCALQIKTKVKEKEDESKQKVVRYIPDQRISPNFLCESLKNLLEKEYGQETQARKKILYEKVIIKAKIRIEHIVSRVKDFFSQQEITSFSNLIALCTSLPEEKREVSILVFLTTLEMIRLGEIEALDESDKEIMLRRLV
jgi:chromatin segregation and condensation protein Rec8/ScpA/Scc1 (kleisin family)